MFVDHCSIQLYIFNMHIIEFFNFFFPPIVGASIMDIRKPTKF